MQRVDGRPWRSAFRLAGIALVAVGLTSCKKPYRVGEYVWVEWQDEREYPAYIVEKKSNTRYRVHFENYDARCDETVDFGRIKGRIEGKVVHPPPPTKGLCAQQTKPTPSGSSVPVSPYKVGDRVRVRWRGSTYSATIVGVVTGDQVLVHYDGHETAWDETIHIDRIVSRR
jgi:hypothetical protein